MKFIWAKENNINKSDVVIIGVPDESGSHALRKGTSRGPNRIRKISNERSIFTRNGIESIALPNFCTCKMRLHDAGNVKKKEVTKFVKNITSKNKKVLPITLGGDHSITFEVLKGLENKKSISVVYFDAHPDFVCSSKNYYGSVVCDAAKLKHVDLKSSVEVGIRAIEKEELLNIKKEEFKTIKEVTYILGGEEIEIVYEDSLDVIKVYIEGKQINSFDLYWFAWYAYHPNTEIY